MLDVQYLQLTWRALFAGAIAALVLFVSAGLEPSFAAPRQEAIVLNDAGVLALNKGDFKTAIANLDLALSTDPSYELAAENLSIAYNNYGLSITSNPEESIKQFHRALFYHSGDATTKANLDGVIGLLHKNPRSFSDRVALGDQALAQHDYIGAFCEYKQALAIKDDSAVADKLKGIAGRPELSRAASTASAKSIADPDNAQAENTLNEVSKANTLLNAGKTAEANALYDQALTKVGAQNKLASVIYCLRGLGYLSKEDAARALDDFNGAIKVISISEAQFPSAQKTAPNLYSLLVTAYNGRYMSCYLLGNYLQAAESQKMLSLLLPEDAANGHIGNAILYMLAGQGGAIL